MERGLAAEIVVIEGERCEELGVIVVLAYRFLGCDTSELFLCFNAMLCLGWVPGCSHRFSALLSPSAGMLYRIAFVPIS